MTSSLKRKLFSMNKNNNGPRCNTKPLLVPEETLKPHLLHSYSRPSPLVPTSFHVGIWEVNIPR